MSRTKAINDMCKMCIYDPKSEGGWRSQVEACTSVNSCPLWPYRPVTVASVHENRKIKNDEEAMDALIAGLEDDDAD
jgi:hypothetical protein